MGDAHIWRNNALMDQVASQIIGSVMELRTAEMEVTKATVVVALTANLTVEMDSASKNLSCVTAFGTAATKQMKITVQNQLALVQRAQGQPEHLLP